MRCLGRSGVVVWAVTCLLTCAPALPDQAPGPSDPDRELRLVSDQWSILEMATAHGAFTVEVEVAGEVDMVALARQLVEPLRDDYAEVLVYFYARGGEQTLPMLRIQWTAANGYVETRY